MSPSCYLIHPKYVTLYMVLVHSTAGSSQTHSVATMLLVALLVSIAITLRVSLTRAIALVWLITLISTVSIIRGICRRLLVSLVVLIVLVPLVVLITLLLRRVALVWDVRLLLGLIWSIALVVIWPVALVRTLVWSVILLVLIAVVFVRSRLFMRLAITLVLAVPALGHRCSLATVSNLRAVRWSSYTNTLVSDVVRYSNLDIWKIPLDLLLHNVLHKHPAFALELAMSAIDHTQDALAQALLNLSH